MPGMWDEFIPMVCRMCHCRRHTAFCRGCCCCCWWWMKNRDDISIFRRIFANAMHTNNFFGASQFFFFSFFLHSNSMNFQFLFSNSFSSSFGCCCRCYYVSFRIHNLKWYTICIVHFISSYTVGIASTPAVTRSLCFNSPPIVERIGRTAQFLRFAAVVVVVNLVFLRQRLLTYLNILCKFTVNIPVYCGNDTVQFDDNSNETKCSTEVG